VGGRVQFVDSDCLEDAVLMTSGIDQRVRVWNTTGTFLGCFLHGPHIIAKRRILEALDGNPEYFGKMCSIGCGSTLSDAAITFSQSPDGRNSVWGLLACRGSHRCCLSQIRTARLLTARMLASVKWERRMQGLIGCVGTATHPVPVNTRGNTAASLGHCRFSRLSLDAGVAVPTLKDGGSQHQKHRETL
jgi:hypothetical protein